MRSTTAKSLRTRSQSLKISEEQLYYLMSRGLTESEATEMIVMGFVEPFTKELPMEYAVELNRLISYEMEGSVGKSLYKSKILLINRL